MVVAGGEGRPKSGARGLAYGGCGEGERDDRLRCVKAGKVAQGCSRRARGHSGVCGRVARWRRGHGEWYGDDDRVDGRRSRRRWRGGGAQPSRRRGTGVATRPMAGRVGGRVWSGRADGTARCCLQATIHGRLAVGTRFH